MNWVARHLGLPGPQFVVISATCAVVGCAAAAVGLSLAQLTGPMPSWLRDALAAAVAVAVAAPAGRRVARQLAVDRDDSQTS